MFTSFLKGSSEIQIKENKHMVRWKISLGIIGTLLSSLLYADTVKIGAVVIDDATALPMSDVEVCFSFKEDVGWRTWTESSKHHKQYILTDSNGFCSAEGESNCGQGGCYVKNPPNGYYHPALGWKKTFTEKNLLGVWQPDNLVATIRLQRVEHPISLWVKKSTLSLDKDISSLPDGRFYFDFLAGDFLPPLGNGRHADVMFTRDAREDRGEGVNGANIKGRSFRDMIRVSFLGKENGLAEIKCDDKNGIRIRQAPESGYLSEYSIWHGVGKDLQFESSHNKDRDFCFRIRTECNDQGSIIKAWYGKIYGDMKIWAGENYSVNGVSFRYYLNSNPLDRNLEWDMKTNLCPNPGSLGQLQP